MLDTSLRPLKDRLLAPLLCSTNLIPPFVHPLHITLLALLAGLLSCYVAASGPRAVPFLLLVLPPGTAEAASTSLFLLNRLLDSLDGALARQRGLQSELGGFLDLLCDFVVYALVPICVGVGRGTSTSSSSSSSSSSGGVGTPFLSNLWLSISLLEASFYLNNFVLFYSAAVLAKLSRSPPSQGQIHLTSLPLRPALVEGFESAVFFALMLFFPARLAPLAWAMSLLVFAGTVQRVVWLSRVLVAAGEGNGREGKRREEKGREGKRGPLAR
ncbi:hypothetical protein MKZ38_001410 [Zalerion maritima]|uniref:Uncharacterized protein n=1 Tax=Zalerion maritima TaxID=339359 RepID=A0AAD5RQA5_9PEZI|nr:hypothetical protein MKZ38_001410 [Zalerion maritima]